MLLSLVVVICVFVGATGFFLHVFNTVIWSLRALDGIRERKHQRVLELLDKQIVADKAKWPAAEQAPLPVSE
ncbi:hypothetical protein [Frigoriglobus tundricola]|uniref:hypothetical protein n=1 Tax=Frigoriglobus tundricola TaxID=2774151 RepID=UPI00148EC81A|nr:hypothetical protein [Frigoriglobus tundricola]